MKIEDEHEICKTKVQTKFISITYENLNMKWNEQRYGARSYFKLMLNRWKVMGFYFYLYPFMDLIQKNFHECFHMPTIQKTFFLSISVTSTKRIKQQDFQTTWTKTCLVLNLGHGIKKSKEKTWHVHNVNAKWLYYKNLIKIQQDCDKNTYPKLMLNRLKVTWHYTFIYTH
jgi:hypothetical protein